MSDVAPPSPAVTRSTNIKDTKSNQKRSSDNVAKGALTTAFQNDKRLKKDEVNNNRNPVEQTVWGAALPEGVLYNIFKCCVKQEGCLPVLCRLGQVCVLWQRVSVSPSLWTNLDLCRWTRKQFRTAKHLKWIIENRMTFCRDVTMTGSDLTYCVVLSIFAKTCPHLTGIKFIGLSGLSSDNLGYLVKQVKSLQRIDLSSTLDDKSAKNSVICTAIQTMNERLTHLHLANNRLKRISQIFTTLSACCPNLISLDLSNSSKPHEILHIEELQQGCTKLKVLRINNLHLNGRETFQMHMDSPGFPDLEELHMVSSFEGSFLMITNEFLLRILKTSTKLELLDVRGCFQLTPHSLIQLPALDLKRLFLFGSTMYCPLVTGLELIALKWAHSLIEFDLSGAYQHAPIDKAIMAIAKKGAESPLKHLNLSSSSVSLNAVKQILINCPHLNSLNLYLCQLRTAPLSVTKLLQGVTELQKMRNILGVVQKHT